MRFYARNSLRLLSFLLICLGTALTADGQYRQTNLTSNSAAPAANTDANLINPWGLAFGPTTPAWVANQGSGKATVYNGAGQPQPTVVTIPVASGPSVVATGPTGVVFNGTSDFQVSGVPAAFIFASLDGAISAWYDPQTSATIVNNQSDRATYTGLALASHNGRNLLYAANEKGISVDVFDSSFTLLNTTDLPGSFQDPTLPAGLVPFNVQPIGSELFVTYAIPPSQAGGSFPVSGVVNVFTTGGEFVRRFATGGPLNGPWGVVRAKPNFGPFADKILIGNDGDGRLNAFEPATGAFLGPLVDENAVPLVNEHLWGLGFGNGAAGFDPDKLYFTAGINDERGGLFGSIEARGDVVPIPLPNLVFAAPIVMGYAAWKMRKVKRVSGTGF
jgi:uncharacterized protein (TIGR03118 family)